MAEAIFISAVVGADNLVSPARLAECLRISKLELSQALGLSRDSVSRQSRIEGQKTQSRLRDVVEIINHVLPWCGSEMAAFAWYRSQPIPSFGDKTAEDMVSEGRARDVKRYLSRIAEGGYA